MATKNVFTSNGKSIVLGKGKLQLNTSTPEFRERVQMFADGINQMNDKALYYGECVRTAQKSLELYCKGAYQDGSVIKAKEDEIEQYKQARTDIMNEIRSRMPEYDTTDKNLYYAYRTFINGEEDSKSGDTYKRAIMEWLDKGGITPTDKGIDYLIAKIGVKAASAKTMCKNGGKEFTTNLGEKQFLQLFYRVMATLMYSQNILKEFKYEYVIKTKKDAE